MVSVAVKTCIMCDTVSRAPTANEPYALAFETSGSVGSAALGHGDRIIESRCFSGPLMHARDFLPTLDAFRRAHSVPPEAIKRVYMSAGPGSFTGLRIGITAARMLALAVGAKLVGVPSLDVIARNALDLPNPPDEVAVLLDAKRGRVYAAAFRRTVGGFTRTCGPDEVDPLEFLTAQPPGCALMGSGIPRHAETVSACGLAVLPEPTWQPRAEVVYRLGHERAERGEFDDPRTLVPIYIRPPEAEEKWEQRKRQRQKR